jgi:hypothetical protein
MMRRGYVLHTIAVTDLPLLDLRSPEALASVGLSLEDNDDRRRQLRAGGAPA